MKTVKDLKEWLEQFPDETEVLFAKQNKAIGYKSWGNVDFVEPDLTPLSECYGYGDTWEFTDFTGNSFVKETDERFNKKYLQFGSKE